MEGFVIEVLVVDDRPIAIDRSGDVVVGDEGDQGLHEPCAIDQPVRRLGALRLGRELAQTFVDVVGMERRQRNRRRRSDQDAFDIFERDPINAGVAVEHNADFVERDLMARSEG